jgi:hypothetical protein
VWTYGGVCHLPKLLNRLPQTSDEFTLLYAAVGRKLVLKESEFSPRRGRKPGSENKKTKESGLPGLDRANKNTRNYRARKKRTIVGLDGEKIVLEPGVSLAPPWER